MQPPVGRILVLVGLALVVVGLLVQAGAFSWFGRLPGDVRYESGSTRVYVPWVSMLAISAVGSLLLHLIRRFL